jgi:hypothetical protein
MSAIFMDGFDHYGAGTISTTNMLDGTYSNVQNLACTVPPWGLARTGQYCLRHTGYGPTGLFYTLPTPGAAFYTSFGFAVDALAMGYARIAEWRDSGSNVLFYLQYTPTGALELLDGSTGTVYGITSGPVIVPQNWHFFEMSINTSTGVFILRVDDATATNTPVLSITNSGITGTIAIMAWLTNFSALAQIDDLFIRDGGGSVNNSFLGDRRVATLFANQDTTTQGWTPNFYEKLGAGILNNTPLAPTGLNAAWAASGTSQNIGAADFTIEGFVRFQSLPTGSNKSVIFGKYDETDNLRSYQLFLGSTSLNNGSLCFQTSTDGTVSTVAQPIIYPFTPNLDTWYHIAVCRASGQLLLFVNGAQLGLPITDTRTYFAGGAPFGIGGQAENTRNQVLTGTSLYGWEDEVRLTVGVSRYTANFTPTTVEFPRGTSDPYWTDVGLLCGFDSLIQDESSYNWAMSSQNAVQQTTSDGPSVGNYSTIGKAIPDDNTFLSAPFVPATSILTITVNPANNSTVTVGTKNGSTAAVYTFKTTLTGAAFEVLIDTNIQNSLQNLFNAINLGPGIGTKYGTGTTVNFNVYATQLPAGQMMVTANAAGTAGNSIATSESGLTGSWTGSTLSGGLNIPGPSTFKVQRLPPTTTLISAVQVSVRAFKSDAGVGTMNTSFIGVLGGATTGPTHNLTISPDYYNDIYQIDPDTSGPISPTTVTNGTIQINRDT